MKIGVAKVCISPYFSDIMLAGFDNPERRFLGVHDDAWTRALYLEDGETKIVLVSNDILHIDRTRLPEIAPEIAEKTGVCIDHILFNASHTHSMPEVNRRPTLVIKNNEKYTDWLYSKMVEAICLAYNNAEEGYLEYGFGPCKELGINRRRIDNGECIMAPNPDGLIREEAFVLRAVCGEKVKAILTKFTCHASTVGKNYASGDWPGYACRGMEANNPGAVALFLQGCCGSVRPRTVQDPEKLSTTHFRPGEYADIMHFGNLLAAAVQRVLDGEMTPVTGKLSAKKHRFSLPFQPKDPIEAYADNPEEDFLMPLYKKYMREHYDEIPTESPYSIQRIDLGDVLTLIALEGEAVVDYEYHMDKVFPHRRVVTLGYSNGAPGYICTAKMLEEGGYESVLSMQYNMMPLWSPDAEQMIIDEAKKIQ